MATNDKDLELKLRISALWRRMAYVVFQEVDLCTFSYRPKYTRKQITDFDVLGIRFDHDFAAHITVAECKSGDDQAMNYLLKLNGVRNFFKAEKGYLVQARIDSNAREVGRETGIWCLDEGNLNQLLAGCGIEEKHLQAERTAYATKAAALEIQKRVFPKTVEYLKYDFWTLPDHRNVVNLLRVFGKMAKLDASKKEHRLLAKQMAVNLGYAISQITADIIRFDISNVPQGVLNRIFGGARERRDREALFDTISKIVPSEKLNVTPEFYPQLAELVQRFANAAKDASQVINCLDHLVREELTGDFTAAWGTAEQVYGSRVLKLARDVYYFINRTSGVPLEIFGMEASLLGVGAPREDSPTT